MVACMALLSGCTESTIVKPTSETVVGDPNFETQENVEIDWTQVSTDAEDMFKDTSTYEYGRDFHFYMEPNKKQIMLIWVVADDLPDDQIGTYAEDLIKGFNDVVHTQDFSIEMSGKIPTADCGNSMHCPTASFRRATRITRTHGLSAVPMRLAQISNFRIPKS